MCPCRERLPKFEPVDLRLDTLLEEGQRLVQEQESVRSHKLSEEYFRNVNVGGGPSLIGLKG